MSAWVDVAVLTGTKTLDGRLVVQSAPGLPFLLSEGVLVHFVPPQLDIPRNAVVEDIQEGAGGDYIVRFEGVDSKTIAGKLVGSHCLVAKDQLDDIQAALADSSFVDYQVEDDRFGIVGIVVDLEEMPAQYLLVVERSDGSGESLIPFVDEFVLDVDSREKRIFTHLPDGILNL